MLENGGWDFIRAPTNASKWQMGFNSAFKGLNLRICLFPTLHNRLEVKLIVEAYKHIHQIIYTPNSCEIYSKDEPWQ